jgi:hypothetical protein
MSYYGLSNTGTKGVQYAGHVDEVPAEGNSIANFVAALLKETPSVGLIILPQLVIAARSSSEYRAYRFRSPMSKSDSEEIMRYLIMVAGRKVKMSEEYGAIESV